MNQLLSGPHGSDGKSPLLERLSVKRSGLPVLLVAAWIARGGAAVERIAIVASLKPGMEERARKLLEGGAPFDPAAAGVTRHVVYLSSDDVVFVFEGQEVGRRMHELVTAPFESALTSALDEWRDIVDGPARIARATYAWDDGEGGPR